MKSEGKPEETIVRNKAKVYSQSKSGSTRLLPPSSRAPAVNLYDRSRPLLHLGLLLGKDKLDVRRARHVG